MKMIRIFLILISFLFLVGCGQSVAVLGPALTIATTGNVQHVVLSQSFNTGIKKKTGKDISEHMVSSATKPLDCTLVSTNELQGVFFDDYQNIDCHLK